jgi:hypothetical protein
MQSTIADRLKRFQIDFLFIALAPARIVEREPGKGQRLTRSIQTSTVAKRAAPSIYRTATHSLIGCFYPSTVDRLRFRTSDIFVRIVTWHGWETGPGPFG